MNSQKKNKINEIHHKNIVYSIILLLVHDLSIDTNEDNEASIFIVFMSAG
jgi:hypothetical protein